MAARGSPLSGNRGSSDGEWLLDHAPLVTPVTDYEPPALGGPPVLPAAPPAPAARPVPPACPARPAGEDDGRTRAAALFADAALRRVLEVIDRRRPPAQLRALVAGGLADSLMSVAGRTAAPRAARLRRVSAQPIGDGTGAEVAASFTRGERVHAIACRVEQVATAAGPRWQLVALHLG